MQGQCLPQVWGVLQSLPCTALSGPPLSPKVAKAHLMSCVCLQSELGLGGELCASSERSSQNQSLQLGLPCSCLLLSCAQGPAMATASTPGHGDRASRSSLVGWAWGSCSRGTGAGRDMPLQAALPVPSLTQQGDTLDVTVLALNVLCPFPQEASGPWR